MSRHLLTFIATILLVMPASAAQWYCGYFTKYPPKHAIYGIIGDLQHGPAITKFTKDPNKIKKYLQHNFCYCVKGNVVYTQQFGNMFKKMNKLAWCPNYDHPEIQEIEL